MDKVFSALVAGVVIALASSPAMASGLDVSCSPGGASGTIQLTDGGSEAIDSFNCGSEFEFSFTNSGSGSQFFDMAFGGSPAYEYSVEGKANPGGYDEINDYSGGTSTSFGYGPGTWDIYVSLIQVPVFADPYGGFELTDIQYDLPIPTGPAPTPLPSTWTMMLIGLIGLGVFAFMQKRTATLAT